MDSLISACEPFLKGLLTCSVQATVLLIMVILIRACIKRTFRFKVVIWLWMLLILRLMWPIQVSAPFSVFNLAPGYLSVDHYFGPAAAGDASVDSVASLEAAGSSPAGREVVTMAAKPDAAEGNPGALKKPETAVAAGVTLFEMVFLVWLLGTLCFVAIIAWAHFRLWRIIAQERPITRQVVLDLLEDCKSSLKLNTVIGLFETDKVSSPCLYGYVRPRLLLPSGATDSLTQEQLRYVFLHELAHLKRHDILLGWLMALVQALHWFNPAVWLAMSKVGQDRELACDELALSTLEGREPIQYGETLLCFLERFAKRRSFAGMTGIVEQKHLMKRRLTMIAQFKPRKVVLWPVLMLLAGLMLTTFTAARPDRLPSGGNDWQAMQTWPESTFLTSAAKEKGLQAMIDAARPGSKLVIPAGIYEEPVTVNKPLMIKGSDPAKCVLKVTANVPAIMVDPKGKGKVLIEGLTIQWQLQTSDRHENPFAVGIKDGTVKVSQCIFRPLGNAQRSPVAVFCKGFSSMILSGCDFEGFEYVICYGEGTKGVMEECFVRNCGHQGVILYRGASVTVKRNIFTGSKYHAVRSTGGKLVCQENLIINNRNRAVYLGNKSSSGVISNNLMIGNAIGVDGISASTYTVTNNVIVKSGFAAVSGRPYARLTLQKNVLANNPRGISFYVKEGSGDKVQSKVGANVLWQNKVETENCDTKAIVKMDPKFVAPDKGDYRLGVKKLRGAGLQKPEILKKLWEKYNKVMKAKK